MPCEGSFYSFPFSGLFQNREVSLPKPAFCLALLFHSGLFPGCNMGVVGFFSFFVSLFFSRMTFLHS